MSSHKLPGKGRQAPAPVSVDLEKQQRCCICFDSYCPSTRDEDAEVPVQLPCGHVFGGTCITRWMQIKTTCPLCRFEFDVEFDDEDDEYDVWIDEHEHDSAVQPSRASSGHTSSTYHSFVSDLPGERITISELGFSAARSSSTAAHRSFDVCSGGTLSAPPQYARQPCRPHSQMGCCYDCGKTSVSHPESEDVWTTALVYEGDDEAAVRVDDGGIVAPDDDTDEAERLELHRQLYSREATVLSVTDFLFDDLLIQHVQWMAELNEARYDVCDVLDFLV